MTFEKWLSKQIKRDDPIGDLAKDFMQAKKMDRDCYGTTNQKCDKEHLSRWHARPIVYKTLKMAREEYEEYINTLE